MGQRGQKLAIRNAKGFKIKARDSLLQASIPRSPQQNTIHGLTESQICDQVELRDGSKMLEKATEYMKAAESTNLAALANS
jgi:hypothetical protein